MIEFLLWGDTEVRINIVQYDHIAQYDHIVLSVDSMKTQWLSLRAAVHLREHEIVAGRLGGSIQSTRYHRWNEIYTRLAAEYHCSIVQQGAIIYTYHCTRC